MVSKKGQISIFLIIGVIILIGTMLVIYISKGLSEVDGEEAVRDAGAFPEVTSFVDLCVEKTLYNGILYTGMRGGYNEVLSPYINYHLHKVPYYFSLGQDVSSDSIDFWRKSIEDYVTDQLLNCISGFDSMPQYKIRWKEQIETEVTIAKETTRARVTMPLEIIKNDKKTIVSDFQADAIVDLNYQFETVKHMLEIQKQGPNKVMMSLLLTLAQERGVSYDMKYDYDSIIYVVYFNQTLAADKEPWIFMFAVRYNWPNAGMNTMVKPMRPQIAVEGQEFIYEIPNTEEAGNYYARTSMFEIDDGIIKFTPTNTQIGMHYVPILVDNGFEIESEILQLTIEDSDKPVMDNVWYATAYVGKEFNLTVPLIHPTNVPVVFTDDSPLFTIDAQTGEIRFTPEEGDEGEHTITAKATTSGKTGTREFILTIV